VIIVRLLVRQHRQAPLAQMIREQPVIFSTRALIRIRTSPAQGSGWGTLKGAPMLVVHGGGIETTIGRGDSLFDGNCIRSSDATMWQGSLGWMGSSIGSRRCVRLHGFNGSTSTGLAVTPRGSSIDDLWQALLRVGVTPTDPAQT
jgi:hypothetical protein